VLAGLGQQVAHRWDAETLESLADIILEQFGGVAGQHHTHGVTDLE